MIQLEERCDLEACRGLVRRVVTSSLISRSSRLREMMLYLSAKVLEEQVSNVHELELGHHVFGRPEYYDTTSDNIVRVHASLLRKRLAEYFRTEGSHEELIIEIPRGNYAPVFKPRSAEDRVPFGAAAPGALDALPVPTPLPLAVPEPSEARPVSFSGVAKAESGGTGRWLWGVAVAFAAALLVITLARHAATSTAVKPKARQLPALWSELFPAGETTQVVLDDAALDLYQKATGHPVALTEYYDRSYLSTVEKTAVNAHFDHDFVRSLLLRRQSSFAGANLVGRLAAIAQGLDSTANVQFARDFSFHQLKSGNVILLGSAGSNPWIQPFENSLSVRWDYDPESDSYHPVDTQSIVPALIEHKPGAETAHQQQSFATVAFLPNLSGTGNVLILSGTGGTAALAALAFIADPASVAQVDSKLPKQSGPMYFEVLLRVEKGAGPRNAQLLVVRAPRRGE